MCPTSDEALYQAAAVTTNANDVLPNSYGLVCVINLAVIVK